MHYLRKLLPLPLIAATLMCIVIWMAAPLASWVLGPSYEATAKAARLFAAMPLVTLLSMAVTAALIGAGRQRRLMHINLVVAVMSIALTLSMVPVFGIEGAIYALYGAEAAGVLAAVWSLRCTS